MSRSSVVQNPRSCFGGVRVPIYPMGSTKQGGRSNNNGGGIYEVTRRGV